MGRILGPRGITAKQLERDTGCKIMVRGKGSMRDKKKVCCKNKTGDDFSLTPGWAPAAAVKYRVEVWSFLLAPNEIRNLVPE